MILYQSGETQIWYYIIFAGAFHLRVDVIFMHCVWKFMIETEFKVVVLKLHLISVSVRSYSVFVLSNIQWRNTSLMANCPTELNNAAICCTNCLKLIGLQSCWYQDLSYKVCVCKMQQILIFCKYHGTICILSTGCFILNCFF